MKLRRANAWPPSRLPIGVAAITALFVLSSAVETPGSGPALLRALLALVIVCLLPGLLLLRLLGVRGLSVAETLVHSVGISVLFVSFVGAASSVLLPLVGIPNPLAFGPLVATLLGAILVLSVVVAIRDGSHTGGRLPTSTWREYRVAALLCLLPVTALLGTHLVNEAGIGWVNITAVLLVSAVTVAVYLGWISRRLYPLVVLSCSLTLLYHTALITDFVWGWDIQFQYYTASRVLNSAWEPGFGRPTNSLVTIVVFSAVGATTIGVPLDVVFKFVYPALYALFPLTVYLVVADRLDRRDAVLSALLIAFYSQFYHRMVGKQHVAQLYMGLFLVAVFVGSIRPRKRRLLAVLYLLGVIVSHYSSPLLYGVVLLLGTLLAYAPAVPPLRRLGPMRAIRTCFSRERTSAFHPAFVIVYFGLLSVWYLYTSNGVVFEKVFMYFPKQILANLFDLFVESAERTGSQTLQSTMTKSPLKRIHLLFHLALQSLIAVGLLKDLVAIGRSKRPALHPLLVLLSVPMFGFLVVAFFVKGSFGSDRAYDLGLVLLAPFGVTGFLFASRFSISRTVGRLTGSQHAIDRDQLYLVFSVFLVLILVFDAGVVYQLAGIPYTLLAFQSGQDYPTFSNQEISGAEWLSEHAGDEPVYADQYGEIILWRYFDHLGDQVNRFWAGTSRVEPGSYIYLRERNIESGLPIRGTRYRYAPRSDSSFGQILCRSNKVFDNGNSVVFEVPRKASEAAAIRRVPVASERDAAPTSPTTSSCPW